MGRQRGRTHCRSRRRRSGLRLYSPPGSLEHIIGRAVSSDREPASRLEPRQSVGDIPGRQCVPVRVQPRQPGVSFPVYSSFLPLPADLKPTTQYSWDAGIQRQLTRPWFASATYLGTKIVNQLSAEELNPALNLAFGPCRLYDATIGTDRDNPPCTT